MFNKVVLHVLFTVLGNNFMTFFLEGESNWREVDVLYVVVFIVSSYEDMKMNNQKGCTRTESNVFLIVCDKKNLCKALKLVGSLSNVQIFLYLWA